MLLRSLGVPESRLSVFPNQTAAWEAAVRGAGVALGIGHLAVHQLRRRELQVIDVSGTPVELVWHAATLPLDRRSPAAASLRHFLSTPQAMKLLRSPARGCRCGTKLHRFGCSIIHCLATLIAGISGICEQ